jgi:hypothetical protein
VGIGALWRGKARQARPGRAWWSVVWRGWLGRAGDDGMATQYYWKRGGGDNDSPTAQIVGKRLAEIAARNGGIEPIYVVEDARNETSPLHKYFEWDDGEAAEKYRLHQARSLVNRVGVRYLDKPDAPIVQAFVNVLPRSDDGDDHQRYEPVLSVMSDAEKRRRFMRQAINELRAWQKRYADLQELAEVFDAINRIDSNKGDGLGLQH